MGLFQDTVRSLLLAVIVHYAATCMIVYQFSCNFQLLTVIWIGASIVLFVFVAEYSLCLLRLFPNKMLWYVYKELGSNLSIFIVVVIDAKCIERFVLCKHMYIMQYSLQPIVGLLDYILNDIKDMQLST